ncbi:response regulator transcription factor [Sulfurimonas sp.]|uniref:response regulator transcription factor n=1 Tax=Sulfurimonas sp. TaxID=2022749 RepID=UPI002B4621DD|nr:response regulator [Sulfurimonas sp.]
MVENSIIIVEDDEITALNLNLSLQKHGYDVVAVCDNAIDAKVKIEELEPDIIIIDISLDESNDGIELGNTVRQEYNIPFIYLTSYSDDDMISQAKQTEPYGYIVKPFDPSSLHATLQMAIFKYEVENKRKVNIEESNVNDFDIEKLLHAKKDIDKPIVYFGDEYYLDIGISETFFKDKKIKLTKKENAFLRLLVAQLASVVTFEQAMDYVWQESGATANSVRTLVWRLRNKLPTDIIKNASGIGYCIEE